MRTITHREMRNHSGEILRAVAGGETIQVTNNGQVAAVISPPGGDTIGELVAAGAAVAASRPAADLAKIEGRRSARSTAEIITDSRGRW